MSLINHFLSALRAKVSSVIENNTKSVSLDDPVDTAFNFFSCQIKPLLLRTSIVSALLSLAHIRRAKAKHLTRCSTHSE